MSRLNPHMSARVGIAGVLGLLAACSGQPARTPSASVQPGDTRVQERVQAAIASDPGLSGRMIDVSVADGVVHLSGFVQSTYDLMLVRGDARTVHGVVDVDERQLAVIRGGTPP